MEELGPRQAEREDVEAENGEVKRRRLGHVDGEERGVCGGEEG